MYQGTPNQASRAPRICVLNADAPTFVQGRAGHVIARALRTSHAVLIINPAVSTAITAPAVPSTSLPAPAYPAPLSPLSPSPSNQEEGCRGLTLSDEVWPPSSVISVMSLNVKGQLAQSQGADNILQAAGSSDIMVFTEIWLGEGWSAPATEEFMVFNLARPQRYQAKSAARRGGIASYFRNNLGKFVTLVESDCTNSYAVLHVN